jgi:hypothetical protein
MNIIDPPQIIDKGIALYAPFNSSYSKEDELLKLEIIYSLKNPAMNIINCSNSEIKIWEITSTQSRTGALFLYQSNQLELGFYTLRLSTIPSDKSGQLTIGVLRPTNKIIIGLPYSIYSHINMS